MALLLFCQALLEFLDQLVETTEGFDLRFFFIAELLCEFLAQPFVGDQGLYHPVHGLNALPKRRHGPVKLVEMLFILDQGGAGQVVELLGIGKGKIRVQGSEQVNMLADGYRYPVLLEAEKQVYQHFPA